MSNNSTYYFKTLQNLLKGFDEYIELQSFVKIMNIVYNSSSMVLPKNNIENDEIFKEMSEFKNYLITQNLTFLSNVLEDEVKKYYIPSKQKTKQKTLWDFSSDASTDYLFTDTIEDCSDIETFLQDWYKWSSRKSIPGKTFLLQRDVVMTSSFSYDYHTLILYSADKTFELYKIIKPFFINIYYSPLDFKLSKITNEDGSIVMQGDELKDIKLKLIKTIQVN